MKTPHKLLALAALLLAVPASAQQVVYSEGFESGLSGWNATGLWNLEDSSDPCGALAAPFVEGTKCAWYGAPGICSFDTGTANSGVIRMNTWIDLPVAPTISVHFWSYSHNEYCWADSYGTQYDVFSLRVYKETGGSPLNQQQCGGSVPPITLLPWHERRFDITAYAGQRVQLEFAFGSGDTLSNNYLGWMVDNITILAEPSVRVCPSTSLVTGCPCGQPSVPVAGGCRNSTGQSATMVTSGSISLANDTFQLRAEHMPSNASAILTQSTGTNAGVVFGDGIRCISGSLLRMGSVLSSGGVATWPIGPETISVRGQVPSAGATRYYYVFYRDVIDFCTPAPFNLTESQRVVWVP